MQLASHCEPLKGRSFLFSVRNTIESYDTHPSMRAARKFLEKLHWG